MEGNVRKVLSGVGFYGTLAVCLAIVGVCGWLLLSGGEEPAGQTQVTPQIPVSQPVEMPEKTVEQPVETLKPEPAVQEAASSMVPSIYMCSSRKSSLSLLVKMRHCASLLVSL